MKSFVFWLATVAAMGALAGSILRPGFPEIVIVWAAVIGLYYWRRSFTTKRRTVSTPS
jgi:hypothetical protein